MKDLTILVENFCGKIFFKKIEINENFFIFKIFLGKNNLDF